MLLSPHYTPSAGTGKAAAQFDDDFNFVPSARTTGRFDSNATLFSPPGSPAVAVEAEPAQLGCVGCVAVSSIQEGPTVSPATSSTSTFGNRSPSPESLRLLEVADESADAALDDANARKARKAVRYALRTNPRLDSLNCDRILGFGSNGVVIAGQVTIGPNNVTPIAVKIIYKAAHHHGTIQPVPSEIDIILSLAAPGLNHKNLLYACDAWQDDRHHYLVTEFFGTDWLGSLIPEQDFASTPAEDLLSFFNPRLGATHTLRVSPGSSDAWALGISKKHQLTRDYLMAHREAEYEDPDLVLPRIPLPEPDFVRTIFRKAVSAVHHLHSVAKIAHGDIKEENVLIESVIYPCDDPTHNHMVHQDLDVRICDFGHSVRAKNGSNRPMLNSYGTAHVTPPELQRSAPGRTGAKKRPAADGIKADIFALGVLLFTLSHGPGRVPSILDAASKNPRVTFPPSGALPMVADFDPRIDDGAVEIIRGMTMIVPGERWSLDRVLAHPWMIQG